MGSEAEGTRQIAKDHGGQITYLWCGVDRSHQLGVLSSAPTPQIVRVPHINAPSSNPRSPPKAVSLPPHLAHFLG